MSAFDPKRTLLVTSRKIVGGTMDSTIRCNTVAFRLPTTVRPISQTGQ